MPSPGADCERAADVLAIKEWMREQPHLPDHFPDVMVRRFLRSCGDAVRARRALLLFFHLRHATPELFRARDPLAPEIQRVFSITDMIPLPNKTKENYKVFLYRMSTSNMELFDFVDAVKTFLMLADTRLSEEQDIPDGEVPIFDSANVSLRFLTKINLSILKKYMIYTQEALPIRLKQVHVINSPAYIERLFSVIRPLLKAELSRQIHFHQPESDTLYRFVPRDLLPAEYGGRAGRLCDLKDCWLRRMEAKRDFFVNDEWGPRSSGAENESATSAIEGTFRSLSVD